MKKKFVGLIALTASLSMCTVLSACGTHEHSWGTDWEHDANEHWHACAGCSEVNDKDAHDFEVVYSADYSKQHQECTICGYDTAEVDHVHNGGTATCASAAVCVDCGQTYGTTLAHAWSNEWSKDASGHWHACTNENCTQKNDEGAHSEVDGDCTTPDDCTICGYELAEASDGHTHGVPAIITGAGDITCANADCEVVVAQTLAEVKTYSTSASDVSLNTLPSAITGTPTSIKVDGTEIWTGSAIDCSELSVQENAIVAVTTANMVYYYRANLCTNIINSAEEFFAMENDLAGYYVLGQDIDFSAQIINSTTDGKGWNTIGWVSNTGGTIGNFNHFKGTLDGQGYALKNITMKGYNGSQGIAACLFAYTDGAVIKNVMIDMTIDGAVAGTIKEAGLIAQAYTTTVSNSVIILRTKSGGYNTNTTVGAVAGTLSTSSKVENCIAILDTSAGITNTKNFGTVAGTAGGNADGIYNSYGIYVGAEGDTWTPVLKASGGLSNTPNSAAYSGYDAFSSAVTELSEENSWNEYWSLTEGTLKFGDEIISSAE